MHVPNKKTTCLQRGYVSYGCEDRRFTGLWLMVFLLFSISTLTVQNRAQGLFRFVHLIGNSTQSRLSVPCKSQSLKRTQHWHWSPYKVGMVNVVTNSCLYSHSAWSCISGLLVKVKSYIYSPFRSPNSSFLASSAAKCSTYIMFNSQTLHCGSVVVPNCTSGWCLPPCSVVVYPTDGQQG